MAVTIDRSFRAEWRAEVLGARPPILPRRHFVYPAAVEEVERGALELMVRPAEGEAVLATCARGVACPACLLICASFHSVEAWGAAGRLWQTARLSWEGVRLGEASARELRGWGWEK